MSLENLIEKIKSKNATVSVIGLGYVGLPLAVESALAGYKTIGFDVQKEKVNDVNNKINYIGDVIPDALSNVVDNGNLKATSDFSLIHDSDIILICVPTPLDKYQQPNISYVKNSTEQIRDNLKKDTLIILESTTYPGTTEELLLPILEASGLKCEEDFLLAFSPERVDPGNEKYKTKNTKKVVGGVGNLASEAAASFYDNILSGGTHVVSSPKVAEMEKLLENTYRNINIGLANEMAIICHRMGIDIWEVIDAASTKPYGFQAFYPGPGLGGHCIPLDPFYLSWKAREFEYHTRLIETSGEINTSMPEYVVERSMKILNRAKKAMSTAKILLLGVAYKADIDDYRESPALSVIYHLEQEGANVDFYDPFIDKINYRNGSMTGLEKINENIIASYDLVIITTAHKNVDYNMVSKNAKAIFDTRNALKDIENRSNIELL